MGLVSALRLGSRRILLTAFTRLVFCQSPCSVAVATVRTASQERMSNFYGLTRWLIGQLARVPDLDFSFCRGLFAAKIEPNRLEGFNTLLGATILFFSPQSESIGMETPASSGQALDNSSA